VSTAIVVAEPVVQLERDACAGLLRELRAGREQRVVRLAEHGTRLALDRHDEPTRERHPLDERDARHLGEDGELGQERGAMLPPSSKSARLSATAFVPMRSAPSSAITAGSGQRRPNLWSSTKETPKSP
jgi:hypothetical protein